EVVRKPLGSSIVRAPHFTGPTRDRPRTAATGCAIAAKSVGPHVTKQRKIRATLRGGDTIANPICDALPGAARSGTRFLELCRWPRQLLFPRSRDSRYTTSTRPTRPPPVRNRILGSLSMATPVAIPSLANVSLDDKYELEAGRVFVTGVQ